MFCARRLLLTTLFLAPCLVGWAQSPASDSPLDLGISQVNEGEFEAAIETLNGVVARLASQGGQLQQVSRAHLYLAIAHLGLSQERAAKSQFIEAIKSNRDLTLSPFEYPPRVIDAFEKAKDEAAPALEPPPPTESQRADMIRAAKAGDFGAVRRLLDQNSGLANSVDHQFGATPLHWAALRGHEAVAALLIAQGADPAVANRDGETPYDVARRSRHAGMVRLLRSSGGAGSGIHVAAQEGDVEGVRRALDQDPSQLNAQDARFGATPLHWAALKGHTHVIRELILRGVDVNAPNRDGETALGVAERSGRAAAIRLLQEAGSGPSLAGFLDAAQAGDASAVRRILGANPDLINQGDRRFGATALHWTALKGHSEVAQVLIELGADVNVTNRDGETPLQVAERSQRLTVASLLRSGQGGATADSGGSPSALYVSAKAGDAAAIRRILSASPDLVNQGDGRFGATALHWAALNGHAEALQALLELGADVNVTNNDGETPLQVAERANQLTAVSMLSSPQAGAPTSPGASLSDLYVAAKAGDAAVITRILRQSPDLINQGDEQFGATALHWAALAGRVTAVQALLELGADVGVMNRDGETPLQVAERSGQLETAAMLRAAAGY